MLTKEILLGLPRTETKADSTTRVAKSIIDDEAALRDAKTLTLRTARLEREASGEADGVANPQPTLAATSQPKR